MGGGGVVRGSRAALTFSFAASPFPTLGDDVARLFAVVALFEGHWLDGRSLWGGRAALVCHFTDILSVVAVLVWALASAQVGPHC